MRKDMFKVIVERPRHGSRYADLYAKARHGRRDDDGDGDSSARESLKARHRRFRKGLNENLNPLQRWLHGQVGRPWDKVYAELSAGIDRRSTVQQHVHQHVGDFVAMKVVRVDNELRYPYWWDGLRPLADASAPRLFVDPDSGLLRLNKGRVRARREYWQQKTLARTTPPSDRRDLGEWRQLHRLNGIWYDVELAPIIDIGKAGNPLFDAIRRRTVRHRGQRQATAGTVTCDRGLFGRDDVYALCKRQLSAKELQHHNLKNGNHDGH